MTPGGWRRSLWPLTVLALAAGGLQDVLPRRAPAAGVIAGCAAVVAASALSRRWPHAGWTGLSVAGSLALAAVGASTTSDVAVAITVISLARRLPILTGAAASILLLAGREAIGELRFGQVEAASLLLGILGVAALYVITVTVSRLQVEQARARAALEELRLTREAQVEAARGEERIRLAREMHDVLGHTLSALAVQLEGARLLLERERAAPAAIEAVARSHRLAREGLDEARRAIGALRGDDLPGPDLLPELVDGFRRDTGVEARLVVDGEPSPLRPEARLALYRAAQEALTNVRRHARARSVEVRLRWQPGAAELVVENDGAAGDQTPAGPRSGYGLTGMRERAELLGGELEVGPAGDRYRVRLRVPAEAAAAPAGG